MVTGQKKNFGFYSHQFFSARYPPFFFFVFYFLQPKPGDVSYSGMHDQGPLPRLNEERGPMSALLNATHAAKTFNDQFMTKIIQKEKERNQKKT